jgi:hypothetical protein
MAAFAMMFFQAPSVLEFQKRLEQRSQFSNLSNVFQVQSVPKDNQLRDTLDQVDTQQLFEIFSDWLARLQRGKHLAKYKFLNRYSKKAIQVNVQIMRAFVQLRHLVINHAELKRELEELRNQTEERFEVVFTV